MSILKSLLAATAGFALAATASAQFSVSGPASLIPASGTGGGGTFPTAAPLTPAVSTVTVPVPVANIDSIVISDIAHTWVGDTMATLADPNGVEHLIWLRPGITSATSFGSSGDFTGTVTMVESGFTPLPTSGNVAPGSYNQSFDSGSGVTWNSGDLGILNTPMSTIAGPAGTWTLTIYDWASGDTGSFSGWTLNGNAGGGGNTGSPFCYGDGSGSTCPCGAFGAPGEGCLTTSGTGAQLVGTGNADVSSDTLTLSVSGGPANKPGIFFQGNSQLNGGNGNPAGDGILCTSGGTIRYAVNALDATGATSQTGFGVNATSGGTKHYQYWFRDPANPCGGQFNFTNGWAVNWL
jgi:hypothetical protein